MENQIKLGKMRIMFVVALSIILIACITTLCVSTYASASNSYTVSNTAATVTDMSNHSVIDVTPASADLNEYSAWTFYSSYVDGDEAVLYDDSDSSWTLFNSLSTVISNPTVLSTDKLRVGLVQENDAYDDSGIGYYEDWYIVISFRASGATYFTDEMVVDGNTSIGTDIKLTELYAYDRLVRLDIVFVKYTDADKEYEYYCNNSYYVQLSDTTEDTPTKVGYTFSGWYTDEACTTPMDTSSAITSDITVYAGWTANEYAIVFNGNGSTSGSMSNLEMTYDVSQNLTVNAFSKTGCLFSGWATSASGSVVYSDGASVMNLATEDGATVNLYAVWQSSEYTVVFNSNKPSGVSGSITGTMENQTFTYGTEQNLSANEYKLDGYTFKGWATSANATSATYTDGQSIKNLTAGGGTITLYAVWEVVKCKITFMVDGSVWKEIEVDWGTTASEVVSENVSSVLYTVDGTLPN